MIIVMALHLLPGLTLRWRNRNPRATVMVTRAPRRVVHHTEELTRENHQQSHRLPCQYQCRHTIAPQVLRLSPPLHNLVVVQAIALEVTIVDEASSVAGGNHEDTRTVVAVDVLQHHHIMRTPVSLMSLDHRLQITPQADLAIMDHPRDTKLLPTVLHHHFAATTRHLRHIPARSDLGPITWHQYLRSKRVGKRFQV